ncbi:MAG: BatD family protein [Deltaproteobacteria bacterium]|nr:BatD family protein [Deltaproteobacteria bacterium]
MCGLRGTRASAGLVALAMGLCAPALAWAAARAQLQTSTRRIALDEELRVTVSASGEFSQMTELASPGFEFRNAGRQSQVSIVNGDIERVENFTFVGTPLQAGKFTIGPVELYLGGQVVARTVAVEVEVVSQADAAGPAVGADQAADLRRYVGQAAFVRPVLSQPHPVVGEPVILTYELYWSRNTQISGVRETSPPRYGGLDTFDLLKERPEPEAVQIAGRVYQRTLTHRVLLTPARPGQVRLDGPAFRLDIGDFFESRAAKIAAAPVVLTVRAVPDAGRPPGFDPSSVGTLRARATLSVGGTSGQSHKVKAGERLLLHYEVAGDGNLLNLRALAPPAVDGMTVEPLPTRATDGVRQSERGTTGQRTWQYVLSFAQAGRFELPETTFGSYDPKTAVFQVDKLGPFTVEVKPADAEATPGPTLGTAAVPVANANPSAGPPAAAGPAALAPKPPAPPQRHTPRPIAATLDLLSSHSQPWYVSPVVPVGAAMPWLALLGLALGDRLRRRRQRMAPQRAEAGALARAEGCLVAAAHRAPDLAYGALRTAVGEYLTLHGVADALNASEAVFVDRLRTRGIAEAHARELAALLQHCDYARYAPAENRSDDLNATAQKLLSALRAMEPQWHRSRATDAAVAAALLLAMVAVAPSVARAADLDSAFAEANQHYIAGRFVQACNAYEAVLARGVQSAALHYNLANAQYQSDRLGFAVANYRQALRLSPGATLRDDIEASLALARQDLAELARRRHETLHVFDESPEIDVALARGAPRTFLALLAMLAGGGVLAAGLWRRQRKNDWRPAAALGACATLQWAAGGWLAFAVHVDRTLVTAVVVAEDAPLVACRGVGEPMGLPEGIEVRKIGELADGRLEIRLANGRQGCVDPSAVRVIR